MKGAAVAVMAAAALGGCASLPERAPSPNLDELLSFSDPALCTPSPTLTRFLGRMVEGGADEGFRAGRIEVPPRFASAIGRIRVRREDGYWVVSVRTRGLWLGLPVVAIHQTFPQGGDPGDFQFEMAAPVADAERRLRIAGFPAKANVDVILGEPVGYAHEMTLVTSPERPGHSFFGCGYH